MLAEERSVAAGGSMKLTEALRNADRIGLICSCTAREVKELACSPGVKASYIWRSNTISMMSDPPADRHDCGGPAGRRAADRAR